MSTFKLPQTAFALALLASAWPMANAARAADLDPGYADVPAPITQQMVTFGSGWYVRGDIAATDSLYKVEATQTADPRVAEVGINRTHDASYGLSLGGGYAFTNQFRADILADFQQPSSTNTYPVTCPARPKQLKPTCTLTGRYDHYDALINGYYDIGTWSIFTPYVGAGVGVGFGGVHTNIINDKYPESGYVGYHSFAYALMAGAAIDVYPHVKIDVGYRYLNEGHVAGLNVYEHQVRAGVRYMIDN